MDASLSHLTNRNAIQTHIPRGLFPQYTQSIHYLLERKKRKKRKKKREERREKREERREKQYQVLLSEGKYPKTIGNRPGGNARNTGTSCIDCNTYLPNTDTIISSHIFTDNSQKERK